MNAGFMPGGTPVEHAYDTTLNSINTSELGGGDKPTNFPTPVSEMLSRNPYLQNATPGEDGIIMLGSVDIKGHNSLHSANNLQPKLPFG